MSNWLKSIVVGLTLVLMNVSCRPEIQGSNSQAALKLIDAVGKNDKAAIAFLTRQLPLAERENLPFLDVQGCFLHRVITIEPPGVNKAADEKTGEVLASWKCPLQHEQVRTVSFTVRSGKIIGINPAIYE